MNHLIWKYQFGVATKRKFVVDVRYKKEDQTDDGRSQRYRDMEDVWEIKREYWTGDVKTQSWRKL